VREEIDLSPYAGQQVLLRFEYVTDDAYNTEGMAIANAAVAEIGWQDDGGGWTPAGFVRAENALPQSFAVQVVEYHPDPVGVRQVPIGPDGRGSLELPSSGSDAAAVVVAVSGLAPLTLQPASYTLSIEPLVP
jgi:immune inhibitor A